MSKMLPSVRIIGGKWRSRRIPISINPALRPSPDRVRETVFNWLGADIIDANCLDLFAGTGVLGFEALSRGAKAVTFVERDFGTMQQLKKCADDFKTHEASFQTQDAVKWLSQPATQLFDVVFLDPPFGQNLLKPVIELLQQHHWLAPQALIYIEMERDLALALPETWQWHRQDKTRHVCFGLGAVKK